ncbi:MAG: GNAT family N-acetyltransferase [Paracoccus sp. (in: a-proteobacteria)]|uniref:GNAT family N-acetyltransferase n=1 Tax=Paracoccus sp. TaxID=267 RepID=UPI0026DF5466|nr:GNAT family N-acetyltransferase [Paracoccus sp. (in: a-proteobacteria)]MDO5614125.1 GNAT family N-acetyltransferase [Paracoccus sp. (in: a-proteobacteria)]
MNDDDRFEVQHRADESRYVLVDRRPGGAGTDEAARIDPAAGSDDGARGEAVIGEESYVDVEPDGGGPVHRVLFHTGVDEAYGGRGLASVLVRDAVDDVVARGYRIVPVCPYVAKWLPKHPEYAAHVVEPTDVHLRAVRERQR